MRFKDDPDGASLWAESAPGGVNVTVSGNPYWTHDTGGFFVSAFPGNGLLVGAILFFCAAGAMMEISASASLPWVWILTVVALVGVAFAGIQVIPFTLLADMAHRVSNNDNISAEATLTGIWTAVEKLGLAIGPALTAACLVFVGIDDLPAAVGMTLSALLLASIPAVLLSRDFQRLR